MSRSLLIIALVSIAMLQACRTVTACDRCRESGTTAFHDPALGGDAMDDSFIDIDDQGGSASFFVVGSAWPQPGGKGSPVTLTYSYQNMFDGSLKMPNGQPLPAGVIRRSIEEALGLWASVAPLNFIEVPDDGLEYWQNSTQYGQIRFRHLFINGPDPSPPAQPIAKAQAYYPGTSVLSGDVQFDNSDPWQIVGTLPAPDILGATIHELGHSIGLAHASIPEANMYWIFTRYSGPGTGALHSDDIAGVRFLYGTGSGQVTPLGAPIPEPATSVLLLVAAGAVWLTRRSR